MQRHVWNLLRIAIVLTLIIAPLGFGIHRLEEMRNFRTVSEGVLYRSGQMTTHGLQRTINDYGIRTVITLRDSYTPGEPPPDRSEEEFCKQNSINYYRLPPRQWSSEEATVPADEGVRKFIQIMAEPRNHPVLVHCFGGVHRAGAFSAIYRMEFEGWSNERAIAELEALGYTDLHSHGDILGYLQRYQPSWRRAKVGNE